MDGCNNGISVKFSRNSRRSNSQSSTSDQTIPADTSKDRGSNDAVRKSNTPKPPAKPKAIDDSITFIDGTIIKQNVTMNKVRANEPVAVNSLYRESKAPVLTLDGSKTDISSEDAINTLMMVKKDVPYQGQSLSCKDVVDALEKSTLEQEIEPHVDSSSGNDHVKLDDLVDEEFVVWMRRLVLNLISLIYGNGVSTIHQFTTMGWRFSFKYGLVFPWVDDWQQMLNYQRNMTYVEGMMGIDNSSFNNEFGNWEANCSDLDTEQKLVFNDYDTKRYDRRKKRVLQLASTLLTLKLPFEVVDNVYICPVILKRK